MNVLVDHVGFAVSLACAALGLGLGLPLALRKIPRNALYGFRVGATMTDDKIWYAVNGSFGKEFSVLGALCLLMGGASLVLLPDRQNQILFVLVVGFVFVLGVLLSLVRGLLLSGRMVKEKEREKAAEGPTPGTDADRGGIRYRV